MTTLEMVEDIFENLGEPTDLEYRNADGNPDTATMGWRRITSAIRTATYNVARWRNPRTGRRFRWFGSTAFAQYRVGEITEEAVATASTVKVVNLTTTTWNAGHFVGWIAEINDEIRRVIYSTEGSIVLATDLSTVPTVGTEINLRKPYVSIEGSWAILRVTDLENGTDLTLVRPEAVLPAANPTVGAPTRYYQAGDRLFVDPVPEDGYLYLEREVLPEVSAVADATNPLPEEFHYPITLWVLVWGFGRYRNPEMRMALRREFNDYMQSIQLPEDSALDRQEDVFVLRTN